MASFNSGDVVVRNMTIRAGGALTNADPGMTAALYVNGAATGNAVTVTNPSVGDYVLSYTVPTGLANNSVLAIKVVGEIGGTGFTEWLEDQFSDLLASLDYSCIADWVLRQPVSEAESSVCTDIPNIAPDTLLYFLKYVAPHAAWFQTLVSTTNCSSNYGCNCGSVNCTSCNNCCY